MKPINIVLATTDIEKNAQLAKLEFDLLEVRVDLLQNCSLPYATRLLKKRRALKRPLLLTVRNDREEGAPRAMSDARKWELLRGLLPLADWVDIELSSKLRGKTIALARALKKKAVVSAHDLQATPKDISALYTKAKAAKADAVKFAFYAQNGDDLLRLIAFTRAHRGEPVITMCVGPWGPLSRLILPRFGSRWVYTFLKESTAPGQLDIRTLSALLERGRTC